MCSLCEFLYIIIELLTCQGRKKFTKMHHFHQVEEKVGDLTNLLYARKRV